MTQGINNNALRVGDSGQLNAATSIWWNYRQLSALVASPGASGATFVPPGANTAGGYQIDGPTEYLYFGGDIHDDWDGSSNVEVEVYFETNVDNSGGLVTDDVYLQLDVFMKGSLEDTCRNQTLGVPVVVGQADQYVQFSCEFKIDFDDLSDPVNVGDVVGMRLNMESELSDVTNIIVNHLEFKYKSTKPNAIEV